MPTKTKSRSAGMKSQRPPMRGHGTAMSSRASTNGAAAESKRRPRGKDAITLLKEEHQKVRRLLRELEAATAKPRREQLLAAIEQELKVHTKIEEDVFYPAYREAGKKKEDRKLYFEAVEEHHVVDMVLLEIKGTNAGSEEFSAKAKVLKDLVEHHAEEEETEMFPRAMKLMDEDERARLGEELARAKESMTGGIMTKLAALVGL